MSFCSPSPLGKTKTVQHECLGLGGALYNRKITLFDDKFKNSIHFLSRTNVVASEIWNDSQLVTPYVFVLE